ncbi:MAG: hypothetical protein ACRC5M_02535, partial [Anaeroplasmataceae bacterium]
FSYVDITVLDYNLEVCKSLLPVLDSLLSSDEVLSNLVPSVDNLNDLSLFVDLLEYSSNLVYSLSDIKDINGDIDVIDSYVDFVESLYDCLQISYKISNVQLSDFDKLESIVDLVSVVGDISKTLSTISDTVDVHKYVAILDYCSELSSITEDISSVIDIKDTKSSSLLLDIIEVIKDSNSTLESISDITILQKDISNLSSYLNNIGGINYECPIYGSILHINNECIPNS